MIRRLALLGGSITALVAAAVATLRGRKRGKGAKGGKEGRRRARRAGGGGPRAGATSPATTQGAPAAAPAAAGPPSAASTEAGAGDELRAIRGIGSVIAERLREAGVTSVDQIAAWSPGDIQDMAARISVKPERIVREDWVGQARSASRSGDSERA